MQVNLKKLDARIQKLQEVRRIAADPELISLLLEFIGTEDERIEPISSARTVLNAPAPSAEELELVDQVLKGMEARPNGGSTAKRA